MEHGPGDGSPANAKLRIKILAHWNVLMTERATARQERVQDEPEPDAEPVTVESALNNAPLPLLVSVAARRLTEELLTRGLDSAVVAHAMTPVVERPKFEPAPVAQKKNKPRFLIMGMRPKDHAVIYRKIHHRAEIICREQSMNMNKLPDVDFCIVSKFCRHPGGWDRCRQIYGFDKTVFVDGGTSMIVRKIEEMLDKGVRRG